MKLSRPAIALAAAAFANAQDWMFPNALYIPGLAKQNSVDFLCQPRLGRDRQ